MIETIRASLWAHIDEPYGQFQRKLLPTLPPERIRGIRTPVLRKLAKEFSKQEGIETFLSALPHDFFEEDQLHAFILSEDRDFVRCAARVEAFLPFVNNWATCDQLSPKVFRKHHADLLPYIRTWLTSSHPYTIRFAIGMLMEHYLGEDFRTEYADMVASVRSEEYYVNMMSAWYFATALAKQYDAILPYLQSPRLDVWTHNKSIQKAIESRRITPEQKAYLRTLKR